jgi:hypothetical protein
MIQAFIFDTQCRYRLDGYRLYEITPDSKKIKKRALVGIDHPMQLSPNVPDTIVEEGAKEISAPPSSPSSEMEAVVTSISQIVQPWMHVPKVIL